MLFYYTIAKTPPSKSSSGATQLFLGLTLFLQSTAVTAYHAILYLLGNIPRLLSDVTVHMFRVIQG